MGKRKRKAGGGGIGSQAVMQLPPFLTDESHNWDMKHDVMMSVVMEKQPPKFEEDWIGVICPVAKRRIIVAAGGCTCSYNKLGGLDRKFQSNLPGGNFQYLQLVRSDDMVILDCLHLKAERTFYVLDLMYWKRMPCYEADAEFRFAWIRGKLEELELDECSLHNEYLFKPLPRIVRCTPGSIITALKETPFLKVDGLLFYHKMVGYRPGPSSSVLWLTLESMKYMLGFPPPEKAGNKPASAETTAANSASVKTSSSSHATPSASSAHIKLTAPSSTQSKPVAPSSAQAKPVAPSSTQTKPVAPSSTQTKPVAPSSAQAKPAAPSSTQAKTVAPSSTLAKTTAASSTQKTRPVAPLSTQAKPVAPSSAQVKPTAPLSTPAKPTASSSTPSKPTAPSSTPSKLTAPSSTPSKPAPPASGSSASVEESTTAEFDKGYGSADVSVELNIDSDKNADVSASGNDLSDDSSGLWLHPDDISLESQNQV